MSLPNFKYHPDPVSTGVIEASEIICEVCGKARGYIYTGPVYAEDEFVNCICPWCIADGAASKAFDAVFVDPAGIGGYGTWPEVSGEIVDEVARHTPGFPGWQQERWFTHCGDAGVFLGIVGKQELARFGSAAVEAIRSESGLNDRNWEHYMNSLNREFSPSAYLFRCRHCGAMGGYSDCD